MRITSSTVCLTVEDVPASAAFLAEHFGFEEVMAADSFASLARADAVGVVFVRRGTEVLPEGFRDRRAEGVIVAFTVDDLDAEYERLRGEGVPVAVPLREEPWGERLFVVTDPNDVHIELVAWAPAEEVSVP